MKYRLINEENLNKYDDLLHLICANRNVDFNNLQMFLYPGDEFVGDASIYKNILLATDVILEAISSNKKICFIVDCDVDGYCSSAMLINYINEKLNYKNMVWLLQSGKEHGLTQEMMNRIDEIECDLVILADSSSNDFSQHKILREKGKKVIVIDHHDADGYSADAVVVNNQLDAVGNKSLSGAGMVMKLLECIDKKLGLDYAKDYLDLCAIALVADCMEMTELETRYYVVSGLLNIKNKLLLEMIDFSKKRNYESISFDIAPVINAFIRVGTQEEKMDLFNSLVGLEYDREISIRGQGTFTLRLPEYINRLGSRIKSRQTSSVEKAIEAAEVNYDGLSISLCILDEFADRKLTGLIGNKLVDRFNKPCLVLKKYNGFYKGSARCTDTFIGFKDYLWETGLFELCQGHQGAFGVVIKSEKMEDLINLFKEIDSEELEKNQAYLVDKTYINRVSAYDILSVSELDNHWGKGFDKPMFYIKLENLTGAEFKVVGAKKDTIRIKHDNITYVKFKCSKEEVERFKSVNIQSLEIIGHFCINEWNDKIYPQVEIVDMEIFGTKKQLGKPMNAFATNFWDIDWSI